MESEFAPLICVGLKGGDAGPSALLRAASPTLKGLSFGDEGSREPLKAPLKAPLEAALKGGDVGPKPLPGLLVLVSAFFVFFGRVTHALKVAARRKACWISRRAASR